MEHSVSDNCLAGVDIGSHTTRLLIAKKTGRRLVPVRSERRVTRLAEGFQREGTITEEARQRNLEALKEYAAILLEFDVDGISCGATGVVRRAKNSEEVLERIGAETGLKCRVLSEESEAELSAKGILSAIRTGDKEPLMFDVGGGSTEFVLPAAQGCVLSTSRPIGAATFTEKFLGGDPPGIEAVNRAATEARRQIESAKTQLFESSLKTGRIVSSGELPLAGTAGTVTTLAAMNLGMKRYVPYLINGAVLSLEWISSAIGSLARMALAERRTLTGLEPGREEIILGGAVIVSQILACFGSDRVIVSDAGLLEGLVIDLAERESGLPGARLAAGPRTDLTWRLPKS